MKGAAGTLGAAKVSQAAAALEVAIREGKDIDPALAALAAALNAAVEAIRTALETGAAKGKDGPSSQIAVAEPLKQLKRLLETDDGEAADFIIDACPDLAGVLTDLEIESLSEFVGDFDFEAALKCLKGISSRLQLNLD